MARRIETVGRSATLGEMVAYCERTLGTRERVKVGHNTYLRRDGEGRYVVRYHATDVVTIDAAAIATGGGRVTLNDGGWDTVTTRARLNGWAPWIAVYRGAPYETVIAAAGYGAPLSDPLRFTGRAELAFTTGGALIAVRPLPR